MTIDATTIQRRSMLIILVCVVFSLQCEDSPTPSDPTCETPFIVEKILPDRNPPMAPILVTGIGFSADVIISFKGIPAETNFVNDSTLTTRVPGELKGTTGQVKLLVVGGACRDSADFTLSPGFEDCERTSPPDIFLPDKSQLIHVSIPDSVDKVPFRSSWFSNVWSQRHYLDIDEYAGNTFRGYETVIRLNSDDEFNSVEGTYDPATKLIELTITNEDQVTHDYTGGFYQTTLSTSRGTETRAFLYLQSRTTGRQYLFRMAE